MIHVTEVNSLHQLAPYREVWAALLAETPQASFFQSLDWLEAYWHHFAAEQQLRVLVVEDQSRPIGILPLVVRHESNRLGTFRVVVYPLNEWGTFYGPIGSDTATILQAGLQHLKATQRDWDIIDLRAIDDERVERGATATALASVGFTAKQSVWNQASVLELPSTWDEYWSSRSSHFRTNVRASERKLLAAHNVRYVRYRPQGAWQADDDPRWDLFDVCRHIASRSWQNCSTSGTTLSHEHVGNFLRDAHLSAARTGALDVNLLWLDEVPAAFLYNYHYRGNVYGLRMGFDRAVSIRGAGNLLTQYMIRDSIERGDRVLDFGPGNEAYKRHWRTRVVPSHRFTYFARNAARAQMLRLKRGVESWLRELSGKHQNVAAK